MSVAAEYGNSELGIFHATCYSSIPLSNQKSTPEPSFTSSGITPPIRCPNILHLFIPSACLRYTLVRFHLQAVVSHGIQILFVFSIPTSCFSSPLTSTARRVSISLSSFASFSAATLARLWLPLGFLCDLNFEACATSDLPFEDFLVSSIKYQILAILSQLAPWVISENYFMYRARCTL